MGSREIKWEIRIACNLLGLELHFLKEHQDSIALSQLPLSAYETSQIVHCLTYNWQIYDNRTYAL